MRKKPHKTFIYGVFGADAKGNCNNNNNNNK